MTLRVLSWVMLAAIVAAVGWRYRDADWVRGWARSGPAEPVRIHFDNGTVREYLPASTPDAAPLAGPAGVRKCRRGSEISYVSGTCPAGSKEQPIAGGTVSVVPGAGAPKPPPAVAAGPRRSTLYDALDPSGEPNLRERAMERAIDPPARRP